MYIHNLLFWRSVRSWCPLHDSVPKNTPWFKKVGDPCLRVSVSHIFNLKSSSINIFILEFKINNGFTIFIFFLQKQTFLAAI